MTRWSDSGIRRRQRTAICAEYEPEPSLSPVDAGLIFGMVTRQVWWDKNADGIRAGDEPLLGSITVRLLQGGPAARGDQFQFTADPNATLVKVPVLFFDDGGARAYTVDHANSLVDGKTVITGEPFGPRVEYLPGKRDILGDYVRAAFVRAGYTEKQVIFADERIYHDGCGSIHCGTNVIRKIPDFNWWSV